MPRRLVRGLVQCFGEHLLISRRRIFGCAHEFEERGLRPGVALGRRRGQRSKDGLSQWQSDLRAILRHLDRPIGLLKHERSQPLALRARLVLGALGPPGRIAGLSLGKTGRRAPVAYWSGIRW